MSDPNKSFTPKASIGHDAVHMVLFGMPEAGKTSLLGALGQAAQTQQNLLNGRLIDGTHGLTELQARLYGDSLQKTVEEVVPYAVVFEPHTTRGHATEDSRVEVVLIDCDGRLAEELLTQRRSLLKESAESGLARAALSADALLLVVDASADSVQVDTNLAELGRFLRGYQQGRGSRSEVGGLPVFLVLTKCDLLGQPADTAATWRERIEDRKRQVHSHYREFFQRQQAEGPVPFGRIDLHLVASAIKRPALADAPAKPREPFGVAELFREACERALAFRRRRVRSRHRLFWAVFGCTASIAALIGLVISLFLYRPPESTSPRELLAKVDSYRLREPQTPSLRLREPLQPKISELTDLRNDREFGALPQDKRDYVLNHLQELQDYRTYKEKIERMTGLRAVRNERELNELEQALVELAPPPEHQSQWSQTEAVLRRAERLGEIKALRAAAADLVTWYAQLLRRGQELITQPKDGSSFSWRDWHERSQSLLQEAETPPQRPTEIALRLDKVNDGREVWLTLQRRLQRARDLSSALGLAGGRPSPLDIPPGFTVAYAASRLQELEKAFPRFKEDFSLVDLPDALAGEIRREVLPRYEHVLKTGREVVLSRFQQLRQGEAETVESWRKLRPWLAAPEELQAWRVLATLLARLLTPEATDPISALDVFLSRDHFDLAVRRVVLEIPDNVKIRPTGKLLIHHRPSSENRPPLAYELAAEERREGQSPATRYKLRPIGDFTLSYRPGDVLWAEILVKSADHGEMMLTWARNRSQVYQFERLVRPPRLHRKGQDNTEGEVVESVLLEVAPEDDLPKVPDLLPVVPVKAEKR